MTESSAPVGFTWDGEAMRPASRFRQQCDRQFVIGQQYVLEERMERSSLSHRHYFASINELWQSLPEHLSAEYPSPEHLRKRALIRCGYRDQRSIVCASNAEALRVAAFIQPVDSYAEISVSGAVVVHLTAVSQNLKSMDRKTFGESKTAVLEWICELVGADPTLVQDAASMGRAA